jgi:hypothetical protein
MKATIEIPDELYRRVKAKSALDGRTIREVTIELYRAWIDQEPASEQVSAEQWLEEMFQWADEVMVDLPQGPTAREILEEDRNRLERR